ncbi:MAG: hypothetical protein ACUVQZ_05590 [Candidatus Caldatribacteriaceae bacterium]
MGYRGGGQENDVSIKGGISSEKSVGVVVSILIVSIIFMGITQAAEVTIRLGSAFEPTHILCQAAERFKKLVEERSNGAIEVQLFLGGVMGLRREMHRSGEYWCVGSTGWGRIAH